MAGKKDADGLNVQQSKFVGFYLTSGNATDAYKKAGYKAKDAVAGAHEILTNLDVSRAIAKRRAEANKAAGTSAEKTLRRLDEEADYKGEGASHSARVSALGLLAKIQGLLKEAPPSAPTQPIVINTITAVLSAPKAPPPDA